MIKLYTDTSANLPLALVKRHSITVIPFSYTVDGVEAEYSAETEFDGKAFYDAMRGGAMVHTSMINASTFMEYFEPDLIAGHEVIYIGMSGGISGTADSAAMAVRELKEKYPGANIAAIDTFAASMGEGKLVLEAAEMIERGASFMSVEHDVLQYRGSMCQFFTVDDLEYLRRGGRISGAVALVGNVLNIKPILRGDEIGRIVMCGKKRGRKRALDELADRYAQRVLDKGADISIAHADNDEGTAYLLEQLRQRGFTGECITVCYEPVTGSHVGPGTVALFFFGTEK